MAAIHEQYTEEMHRQFGYFASWLPSNRLELGDVGTLRRDRFDKITSLARLGVRFQVGTADEPVDLEYSSAGQVDVSVNANAHLDTGPVAKPSATITVTFNRANATLFQAARCTVESVLDLSTLEEQLCRLKRAESWSLDYVVVTELVRTGPAAILISNQKGAKVEFQVDAGVLGGDSLQVAKASVGLPIMSTSGLAVKVIALSGVTPLNRAGRLRRRFTADPRLVYRSGKSVGDPPRELTDDLELAAVAWDDVAGGLDGL